MVGELATFGVAKIGLALSSASVSSDASDRHLLVRSDNRTDHHRPRFESSSLNGHSRSVGTSRRASESDDHAHVGRISDVISGDANVNTDAANITDSTRGLPARREAPPLSPRLLDVRAAAAYLSVSTWTVRDWVAAGHLVAVELPPLRPREGDRGKRRLRRLLFDRAALDKFVDGLGGTRD
jgi:hypothetical protein